jgi:hypothetical protein
LTSALTYWDINAVSNSELTALAKAYNAIPDNRAELEDIFNFGSLVDAMLTENWRVDHEFKTLTQDDGSVIQFDTKIYFQAYTLANYCRKDPVIAAVIKHMVGQYIFVRNLTFMYEADSYTIKGKCKFDAYGKSIKMGADYKTTSCATAKQFREAIDFFHWDRQGAWYMDLGRIDRHWIIGISKTSGQIFKHAIQRGDATYTAGRDKYSKLAYRWQLLNMEAFIQQPLIITI